MSAPSLYDYAQAKRLDAAWLREKLFMREEARGLRLPYLNAQGETAAVRLRHAQDAPCRFSWAKGGEPLPYGLWLRLNREAGGLVLCEGESDAQSLWTMGLPGLGIPGAAAFGRGWTRWLRPVPLWLHVENDQGGETFLRHTLERLKEEGFRAPVYRFRAADIDPGCKDLSDLMVKLGPEAARTAIRQALARREAAEASVPQSESRPPRGGLSAYPASSLWGAALPRPLMVLDNTLTAGLCMLAGAPKKGKSWLALALAIGVARGEKVLGRATRGGEVLYLDLESRQYRVQERLAALLDGPPPEKLFISHQAPRLSGGLIGALEEWLRAHPQTALIIIDTLARVKSPGQGGENAYEADSRLMGDLQRLALDHGLCLLVIHHLRKSASGLRESDVYERVSGSTGLTGVCDCVLVLEGRRQESEAMLHVDGRDIPARQLALCFDAGRWTLLSEDGAGYLRGTAYEASPLPRALRRLMAGREKWEGSASGLCEELARVDETCDELLPEQVYGLLQPLLPALREKEGIAVQRLRSGGRRVLRLTRQPSAPDRAEPEAGEA